MKCAPRGLLLFLDMCEENDLPLQIRLPNQSAFDAPLPGKVVRLLDGRYVIVRVNRALNGTVCVRRVIFDPAEVVGFEWMHGRDAAPIIYCSDFRGCISYY